MQLRRLVRRLNAPLIRYLLIGVINTAFGYAMFAILTYLGLHYTLAVFMSTVVGIIFNFKTYGRFVFGQSNWRLIWRFIAVYGFLYGINIGCIFLLMKHINTIYTASGIALIVTAGLGFLLNRCFVYV